MDNKTIKVQCLEDFVKKNMYFDILFTKGEVFEIIDFQGKQLLKTGIYNIDFSRVSEYFKVIN